MELNPLLSRVPGCIVKLKRKRFKIPKTLSCNIKGALGQARRNESKLDPLLLSTYDEKLKSWENEVNEEEV
jgi:hypothetical protein